MVLYYTKQSLGDAAHEQVTAIGGGGEVKPPPSSLVDLDALDAICRRMKAFDEAREVRGGEGCMVWVGWLAGWDVTVES